MPADNDSVLQGGCLRPIIESGLGDAVLVVDLPDADRDRVEAIGADFFFAADLTDGTQCRAAVADAVWCFSRLDILINHAGIGYVATVTGAAWDIDLGWTALTAAPGQAPVAPLGAASAAFDNGTKRTRGRL